MNEICSNEYCFLYTENNIHWSKFHLLISRIFYHESENSFKSRQCTKGQSMIIQLSKQTYWAWCCQLPPWSLIRCQVWTNWPHVIIHQSSYYSLVYWEHVNCPVLIFTGLATVCLLLRIVSLLPTCCGFKPWNPVTFIIKQVLQLFPGIECVHMVPGWKLLFIYHGWQFLSTNIRNKIYWSFIFWIMTHSHSMDENVQRGITSGFAQEGCSVHPFGFAVESCSSVVTLYWCVFFSIWEK